MFLSRTVRIPRKPFSELDYARHMPKEYVERTKRIVPKKVFGGRFGAPAVIRWTVHPDDYVPSHFRPWEEEQITKSLAREDKYFQGRLSNKFIEPIRPKNKRMADDQWTFFPGDLVQIMVGKDKGRQGTVNVVSRDTSEVLVEGMHCKFESVGNENLGVSDIARWKEQPLSVRDNHVKLLDPNDKEPCDAKWILDDTGTEYIRISIRSGFKIPVPSQAHVTYEYVQPGKYIECTNKDTPASEVLKRTYVPKLASFEEEISQEMGLDDERQLKPSYWY